MLRNHCAEDVQVPREQGQEPGLQAELKLGLGLWLQLEVVERVGATRTLQQVVLAVTKTAKSLCANGLGEGKLEGDAKKRGD